MELTPEARKLKAAYLREWRAKNPGKQREYDQRKWEKKAEALRAQGQSEAAAV